MSSANCDFSIESGNEDIAFGLTGSNRAMLTNLKQFDRELKNSYVLVLKGIAKQVMYTKFRPNLDTFRYNSFHLRIFRILIL